MANLRTLVASVSVPQLPGVYLNSWRSSSGTKSGFLSSAMAFGQKSCISLHFKNGRMSHVGHAVRISASSAEAPTKGNVTISLEGVQVSDPSGGKVSVTSLWENRKAVVAFTRHFGCLLCRKRAALLEARKAEFDAAGVALVLIAPGLPEQARIFRENNNFTGEVYADPDYAVYEALDVAKGVFSVINLKSGQRVLQAMSEGWRLDWELSAYKDTVQSGAWYSLGTYSSMGLPAVRKAVIAVVHFWLQGGILVAGPGKDYIHYFFKDAEAGDEPNMNEVMSACCTTRSLRDKLPHNL